MVTKTEIPAYKQMLEIIPSFAEDEDCDKVPPVRYLFRWGLQDGKQNKAYGIYCLLCHLVLMKESFYIFSLINILKSKEGQVKVKVRGHTENMILVGK